MFIFGSGTMILKPYGLSVAANPTPTQLGTMQDVSVDISTAQKELFGKNQFPVAIARTGGKVSMKAKSANITAKGLNDVFFGSSVVAGQTIGVIDEPHTPVSSSFTVTPPNSGIFAEDLGVVDGVTGKVMVLKTTPALGQYNVVAGAYTFNSGDTGLKLVTYSYSISGGNTSNIVNKPMGTQPVFEVNLINNQYVNPQSSAVNFKMRFPNCIAAKLTMNFKNEDFMIPEFDFSAFADAAGNIFYWDLDE